MSIPREGEREEREEREDYRRPILGETERLKPAASDDALSAEIGDYYLGTVYSHYFAVGISMLFNTST